MPLNAEALHIPIKDPVSEVLKWVLLAVAILTFGLMGWATKVTYRASPPLPERFVTAAGATLLTGEDVVVGKAGFQKADLMDYGSLYGMGSYYGEDYTASILVRLAELTRDNVARARYGRAFAALGAEDQASASATMRAQLQQVDLTRGQVVITDALAAAISVTQTQIAKRLEPVDPATGWTPAYSLDQREAAATADFLIYSSLTTVARRAGVTWSWTENWPYEPMVGNAPTANTFT